jgi:hypothetical protein
MATNAFFEQLAQENPRLAIKYMAHLASQMRGSSESTWNQAILARVEGDFDAVERACDREDALQVRIRELSEPYFKEHAIIGNNGTDGQSRLICDVLLEPPMSREYMMLPREVVDA